jgi:hypothetical protein
VIFMHLSLYVSWHFSLASFSILFGLSGFGI